MGFCITGGKGFQIAFENGYVVSVQFGAYNYCEGYWSDSRFEVGEQEKMDIEKGIYPIKPNAETALIAPDGEFINWPLGSEDMVQSFRSPAQVLELMNYAANLPTKETK